MKLEVCVRSEPSGPYWVANIITTCGQLLLLRYEGYQDDRRADFWCDIMTADLHPLGWSRQHGKTMRAPEGEAWLPSKKSEFMVVFFHLIVCRGQICNMNWIIKLNELHSAVSAVITLISDANVQEVFWVCAILFFPSLNFRHKQLVDKQAFQQREQTAYLWRT